MYCSWDDRCIHASKRCNGHDDCTNGEDEKGCALLQKRTEAILNPLEENSVLPEPVLSSALRSTRRVSHPISWQITPELSQPHQQVIDLTPLRTTTTTTTTTATPSTTTRTTPAPVQQVVHQVQVQQEVVDGPRFVPRYDYTWPRVTVTSSTTTTSTPAPSTYDPERLRLQRERLMRRWSAYNHWTTSAGTTSTPAIKTTTTTTTSAPITQQERLSNTWRWNQWWNRNASASLPIRTSGNRVDQEEGYLPVVQPQQQRLHSEDPVPKKKVKQQHEEDPVDPQAARIPDRGTSSPSAVPASGLQTAGSGLASSGSRKTHDMRCQCTCSPSLF